VGANPEMLKAQSKVMANFKIEHEQILTDLSHSAAIDFYVTLHKADVYIFFDLDCIPLNDTIVKRAIEYAKAGKVFGCAQNANHIPNNKDYASSFFIAFSEETFNKVERPSFAAHQYGDVASELSYRIGHKNVALLYPTKCENVKWQLSNGDVFGLGTTYGNDIYHAFESRHHNESEGMFLNKCKEVLNG